MILTNHRTKRLKIHLHKDDPATYVDLVKVVLDYKPGSKAEMHDREHILDKCFVDDGYDERDTEQLTEVELTAEQLVKIRKLANEYPWQVRHKELTRFLDYLDALNDPSLEKAVK